MDRDTVDAILAIVPATATFRDDHCVSLKLTGGILGGLVRRIDKVPVLRLVSRLERLEELDLRRNRCGELPDLGLRCLTWLDLGSNYMGSVPDWIRPLPLKYLNLGVNELKVIPDWIGELPLTTLKLHKNQIKCVDAIAPLKLNSLNLYLNGLKQFPKCIWDFDLHTFSWGVSGVTVLPEIPWKNLEWFVCIANRIERLPNSFCDLSKLKGAFLNKNRLTCLPERIGELQSLKHLFLYKNRIQWVPESFGHLRLERFNMDKN